MKISWKYLIHLFVFCSIFESCNQGAVKKDVTYHNYSLKQLRGYLSGDWINKSERKEEDNNVFWRFEFRSDSSGIFQNYEHTANGDVMPTCPPVFRISKKGSKYIIKFTAILSILPNNGAIITTITDRKLVMIDRNNLEVYEKINFQK